MGCNHYSVQLFKHDFIDVELCKEMKPIGKPITHIYELSILDCFTRGTWNIFNVYV